MTIDRNESTPDAGPPEPDSPERVWPAIEDAYEPSADGTGDVGEDDPQLLNGTSRALASEEIDADERSETGGTSRSDSDDLSDTGPVSDDAAPSGQDAAERGAANWDTEVSAHKIVVELKRIEGEVRSLLENRDPKRKRKLGGTRRWFELEEDMISWRYTNRIDETTLKRLHELVARRHHLFRRLKFLAGTRPTWNS